MPEAIALATHSQQWQDCVADVADVEARGSGNAYAICTAQLGPSVDADDAAAEPTSAKHPHKNLGPFLHKKGATVPMPAADAYSQRRHAQIHALDDHDGTRGVQPEAAGVGVDSEVDESPRSQVPGTLPPGYETGDGELVMNSRCALCGTGLSTHDLPAGKGTHCADCAKSLAEEPGAGSEVEFGGPSKKSGAGRTVPPAPHSVNKGVLHNVAVSTGQRDPGIDVCGS